jgi:hypothetical protein
MFEVKYFGLPLWVWLVVAGIVALSCYQTMNCSADTAKAAKTETKEKFADVSKDKSKSKIKVFNFNTSWCGWSRRFQPEWDQFSSRVKTDPKLAHIDALDVKCDDSANESMCEKYQVPGYPFVVIEVDGKRTQYDGERTADALVKYLTE